MLDLERVTTRHYLHGTGSRLDLDKLFRLHVCVLSEATIFQRESKRTRKQKNKKQSKTPCTWVLITSFGTSSIEVIKISFLGTLFGIGIIGLPHRNSQFVYYILCSPM